ncbi:MAG: N-acetylmuramoyl-L-alanine amidase [Phycisphaerae bacterium]|nr:N-acetylmuramoyl-L-alanine amidase [Phycisphaerae bacterium]
MSDAANRIAVACLAVMLGAMLCGCKPPEGDNIHHGGGAVVRPPAGTLSIYQLAGRLNMHVVRTSAGSATLRNTSHAVVVFADPNGQVHLDGRVVGSTGGITCVGGILFVSAARVEPLQQALARAPDLKPTRRRKRQRPDPHRRAKPRGVIVLDAGHGGRDPGCTSVYGLAEKAVNLPVVTETARRLRARGYTVVLTRSDDRFVELNERAAIANRHNADLFVSVHADWAPNASAQGYTVYIAKGAGEASSTAAEVFDRHLGRIAAHSRGVRYADFRVLVRTTCPAALIELGYMSNAAEARQLADRAYQRRLAAAIAEGADAFVPSRR